MRLHSPPGGAAVIGLLKKAGLLDAIKPNLVENGTCMQRRVELVCNGKADAMIVEFPSALSGAVFSVRAAVFLNW